ncbi:thermonuclease family protein [Pelagibius litoralis]|uniref:Thermonuclease family protein n=1 Tax=Pelagibius litoralis TaxID=374515 RepID=A0A967F355_9PROT|nr:thermonuclease family protein [Pelagibius litoralis]NIA72363.1 thermonuclease family protein [Pelagibius litoralis]
MTRLALALFACLLAFPAQAQDCHSWPLESVYDGDSVRATVNGESTRIRVMGLDTPEMPPRAKCEAEKAGAYAARDRLRALSEGAAVTFCPDGKDRYGRTLAVMLIDGVDVAEILIAEGLAREYHGGRRQGWCG